ncbi:lymphokine-activated killer T-cell-originated protein kinase [Cochliomyia hominivorax]
METPKRVLRNLHHGNVQEVNSPFKVPASPLLKSLGYGTGVNVYYLERSPRPSGQLRSPWAIKRVSERIRVTNKENSKLFNERIVKEAEILRQLKHPNIVGFRAITQGKDGADTLALECCTISLGMLLENRLEDELGALPAHHIKKMMLDISSALDYLHTESKMLHGDLKSHNILVKGDFEICKLCDFGVSLALNKEGVVNFKETPQLQYVGTNLWCAPEVIREDDVIDSKAEIFSFGLIIYETIALVPPHTLSLDNSQSTDDPEEEDSICDEKPGDFTLMEMAYGTRPALPQAFDLNEDYNIVIELFYLCTNSCPDDRPSAKIIFDSLSTECGTK